MAASWKSTVIPAPGHPSVLTRRVGYLLKKTEEKDSLMALTSASGQTVIDLILMFKISFVASQSSGPTYKMQSKSSGAHQQSSFIKSIIQILHLDIRRWCF